MHLFLERGEGRQKERERTIIMREISISCLLYGTEPTTQACALTRN